MPEAPAATAVIPPHDAPYDPAGEDWVVTGCVDGCIRLWHVPSRTLLRAMSGHRDVVWSAAEAEVKPQPKHIMPSIWAAAMQDAADDAVEEGIRKQLTSSTAADKLDSTGLNLKSAWCAFTMATPPLEAMDFIKLKIRPPGKPEFVLDPDRSIDLKVYFFGDGDDGQTTTVALPSLEPLNRAFEGGLTAHYRDAAELALGLTAVRKGYISMNSGEVTAISSTPPPTPLPLVTDAAAAASGSTSGVGTRRTISSSGGGASGSSNGEGAHDTCSSSGGGASGSSSGGGASASSSGGGGSSVGGTPPMLVPNVDDPTLAAEIMPVGQKSVADA